MIQVKATELRKHHPTYLGKVKSGVEVAVTSRGKVIVRLVPETDECGAARSRLEAIRKTSWVGDVVSPSGEVWEAELGTP
jgi:antitoxin (DNA-binding transcriptional repressor) of toxin-antitoxin stability system